MVAGPTVLADASGMRFPLLDQSHALAVIGTELIIRGVIPHQRNDAKARRLVLTRIALVFRVRRSAILIQRLAIALPAPLALGAVITHGRRLVTRTLLHEDFALVPDVPVLAFAVIPRIVREEVELVVLSPERCDAGGASGSVLAAEGGNFRTGGDLAKFQCRDEVFAIACEDCGAYEKSKRYHV
jgi:hypothetical protein